MYYAFSSRFKPYPTPISDRNAHTQNTENTIKAVCFVSKKLFISVVTTVKRPTDAVVYATSKNPAVLGIFPPFKYKKDHVLPKNVVLAETLDIG